MRYGFGVDLGGTTVKIAYFDEVGTMISKWQIPTVVENEGRQILPDIAASISQYIEKNGIDRNVILGVGIGVPGPVDGKGMVNKCVNFSWGRFSIVDTLSALVGFPVKAGNDANVAALGEYWKGGGKGYQNMILATLGTGVGGGVSKAGEMLLDGVRPHFERSVFHAARGTQFALDSLGNDAGAYGAFKLALDAFG